MLPDPLEQIVEAVAVLYIAYFRSPEELDEEAWRLLDSEEISLREQVDEARKKVEGWLKEQGYDVDD